MIEFAGVVSVLLAMLGLDAIADLRASIEKGER